MIGLGAAALMGGGALLGGALGASAASRAADKAAGAQRYAADLQLQQFREQQAAQEPWRQAGIRALPQLESYAPASMEGWEQDPGYQFRLNEGMRALEQSAAARGRLGTGNTLRSLVDYGQGTGAQEYQNVWNRRQAENNQGFNRLASLAGLGQTANTALANAGQNYANQVGQGAMNTAAIQGNAGMAQANAWGNTIGQLSQLGGRYMAGGFGSNAVNPMDSYIGGSAGATYSPSQGWNYPGGIPTTS